MPAAYAHHRFGEYCISVMPEELRRICTKYREIFDFGVHGPDILFYYKPLSHNEVNGHGSALHRWSGEKFFSHCREILAGTEDDERDALTAYILGFLAHFTLDSSCHLYINQSAAEGECSHNLIESQYEAYLMRLDGRDPLRVDRSRTIRPSRFSAHIISKLFPFDEGKVLRSLKGQHNTLKLFYSPAQVKKNVIRKVIALAGISGNFGDLFLDEEVIPACSAHNEEIYSRYRKAEEVYLKMLDNLMDFIHDGVELGEEFRLDFEGEAAEAV